MAKSAFNTVAVIAGFTVASSTVWGVFGLLSALQLGADKIVLAGLLGSFLGAFMVVVYLMSLVQIDGDPLSIAHRIGAGAAVAVLGGFFGWIIGAVSYATYGIMGSFIGGMVGLFAGALFVDHLEKNSYDWDTANPVKQPPARRFTASEVEVVAVNAIDWKSVVSDGATRVEARNPDLSTGQLKAAVAAALLANEEAGAYTLEVDQGKVNLHYGPNLPTTEWPTGTLEDRLGHPEARRPDDKVQRVADIIEHNRFNPWEAAGRQVMERLADRGILHLEVLPRKVWGLFTVASKHYVLRAETSVVLASPVGQQALHAVENCQRTRNDLYRRLLGEIGEGFERQKPSE